MVDPIECIGLAFGDGKTEPKTCGTIINCWIMEVLVRAHLAPELLWVGLQVLRHPVRGLIVMRRDAVFRGHGNCQGCHLQPQPSTQAARALLTLHRNCANALRVADGCIVHVSGSLPLQTQY